MSLKFIHFILDNNVSSRLNNIVNGNPDHTIIRISKRRFLSYERVELQNDQVDLKIINSDVICIHFLNDFSAKIINKFHKGKRIVWFAWGGDIFNLGKFGNEFLLPKTRNLSFKHNVSSFKGIKHLFWRNAGSLTDLIPPNSIVLNAIKKVEVIVPIVKRDYQSLKDKYSVNAKLFEQNYLNDLMVEEPEVTLVENRKNIVLGNSASFTNNHIEAIDKLTEFDLSNMKVHIPLSYGDSWYMNQIKIYAESKLGKSADVLMNRLPLEDYLKMYASSKHVIMNHARQQAMGNFVFAMYCKTTMYMNYDGNHTKDMLDRGFNILNIEDFHPDNELTEDQKVENRKLLYKWFGKDYLRSRFLEFQSFIETNLFQQIRK